MEKTGYIILAVAALIWLGVILFGLIEALPWGLIGFLVLIGFGLLLAQVIKDRLKNREDDYYSKNVDQ